MIQVPVSEVIPVVVDPSSEHFGQMGRMRMYDLEVGDAYISFEDNNETMVKLNDGYASGLPQYLSFLISEEAELTRLITALPEMKDKLTEFFSSVDRPNGHTLTDKTKSAKIGFTALIKSITN